MTPQQPPPQSLFRDLETLSPTKDRVQRVFDSWIDNYGGRSTLTDTRYRLIATRLKRWTTDELCLLVDYAFNANTKEARFWRGEEMASKRQYLQLDNIFRASKIPKRLENARRWRQNHDDHEVSEGVMLSFVGIMRRNARQAG
jgi:hypothetical protein